MALNQGTVKLWAVAKVEAAMAESTAWTDQ